MPRDLPVILDEEIGEWSSKIEIRPVGEAGGRCVAEEKIR